MSTSTSVSTRSITRRSLRRNFAIVSAAGQAFAIALPMLLGGIAYATPQGAQVISGQASFIQRGGLTQITAANNTIINYNSFNIGRNEHVQFIQPGATSVVLNRVLDMMPTRIDGQLSSNGRVVLVNPAGVFFGNGAMLNVGELMASAGNITNDNFLRGRMEFDHTGGTVSNRGTINGSGNVVLAGSFVENYGAITSSNGSVVFAAGDKVLVSTAGSRVYAEVSTTGSTKANADLSNSTGITNAGTISAPRGRIAMGAGDIYATAIHATSTSRMNAQAVEITANVKPDAPESGLVMISGGIDVSNVAGKGGDVTITGGQIGLVGADINASGSTGGGNIRVGGDYRGLGAMQRADGVFVDRDTTLRADATTTGNGGRIIVWADNALRFFGAASVNGAGSGGDGGLIETSTGNWFEIQPRQISASGSLLGGSPGTWLLDPRNVTIAAINFNISAGPNFLPNGNDATINVATINAALTGGASVTVLTFDPSLIFPALPGQPGNITVASPITSAGAGTLTLIAAGRINIDANITGGGALNLALFAGNLSGTEPNNPLPVGATARDINVANSITINLNGGSLNASGVNFTMGAGSSISAAGGYQLAMLGNVTLFTTGPTTFNSVPSTVGGNLAIIAASGNITQSQPLTVTGTSSFTTSTANNEVILTNGGNSLGGAIRFDTTGATGNASVTNAAVGGTSIAASTVGGRATIVSSAGGLTSTGTLTAAEAFLTVGGAGTSIGANAGSRFALNTSGEIRLFAAAASTNNDAFISNSNAGTSILIANGLGVNLRNIDYRGSAGNVQLATAVNLLLADGNLTVLLDAAGGNITVPAAAVVTVNGASLAGTVISLTAGATTGTIVMGVGSTINIGGDAGETVLNLASGGLSTIFVDGLSTTLGNIAIGGNFNITANTGSLVRTVGTADTFVIGGDLVVNTLTADDDIVIDAGITGVAAAITGTTSLNTTGAGGDATIFATALNFTTSTVGGNLIATATTGNIVDAGTLTVLGTSNFTTQASNATIVIDFPAVLTGAVSLNTTGASGNATLVNNAAGGTDLGASTVGGALTVTSQQGNITDSGALTVTGASSFTTTAATATITLDNPAALTGAASFNTNGAGSNVTLVNTIGSDLGASTIGGSFTVTSDTGDITNSGAITTTGTTTFNATAGAINVGTGSNYTGTGAISLNSLNNATFTNQTAINFGSATSAIGGNGAFVAVTGNITDGAQIGVTGTSSFTTTALNATITLDFPANLTGAVSFNTNGAGGNVTLVNAIGIDLGTSTVGGNLTLTANTGDITDTGISTVAGAFSATTLTAGNDITLDLLAVAGPLTFSTVGPDGNVDITNATGIALAGQTINGSLRVTATTGNITQSGSVQFGGATGGSPESLFNAIAGSVTLNDASNIFGGPLQLGSFLATSITNNAVAGTLLSNTNVTGNLTILNSQGAFSQQGTGAVVGGTTSITNTQANQDLDFNNTGNQLTGDITLVTNGTGNAQLFNQSNTNLAAATSIGGFLRVSGNGNITNAAGATVTGNGTGFAGTDAGTVIFGSTAGNITIADLNYAANQFRLVTTGTGNATLSHDAIILNGTNVAGNLSLTAATGGISQTGLNVIVGGTSTLTTSALGQSIVLADLTNSFTGAMLLNTSGGGNVTLGNAIGTNIGLSGVSGNFDVTSATGDITNSGIITTGGTTTFNAQAGAVNVGTVNNYTGTGDIILNSTGNSTFTNQTAINFGAAGSTIGGNASIVAVIGNITDSGQVAVTGTSSFTTTAANVSITLDNPAALTGAVSFFTNGFGGDVTLVNNRATDLGLSSVGGNINISSAGNLIDSGIATVAGSGTFATTVSNATIFLDQLAVTGEFFLTTGIGGNTVAHADIVNATAIVLNASTVRGHLNARATTGNITDSGAVVVDGVDLSTFRTDAVGADIILDNITFNTANGGSVGFLTFGPGGDAILTHNAAGVNLGTTTVGGTLTINSSGGTITNRTGVVVGFGGGNVTASNGATFNTTGAIAGDILLGGVGNTFGLTGGQLSLTTNLDVDADASVIGATALTLSASIIGADLTVNTGANALTIAGAQSSGDFANAWNDATPGAISLTGSAVNINSNLSTARGNITINSPAVVGANVTISSAVYNNAIPGGTTFLTNNGSIAFLGNLTQTGGNRVVTIRTPRGAEVAAASTAIPFISFGPAATTITVGTLNLNTTGTRANPSRLSTIAFLRTGGVTLNNAVAFAMGQGERLVSNGNFAITSPTATFGDIGIFGNGTFTVPTVTVLRRAGAAVLFGNNDPLVAGETQANDGGTNIIIRGNFNRTGTWTSTGVGIRPIIATGNLNLLPGTSFNNHYFPNLPIPYPSLATTGNNDSSVGGSPADLSAGLTSLRALTLPFDDMATAFAYNPMGDISQFDDTFANSGFNGAQRAALTAMGINVRNASNSELFDGLSGSTSFNDRSSGKIRPSASDIMVVRDRLGYTATVRAIEAWDKLAAMSGAAAAVKAAADAYAAGNPGGLNANPAGFAEWLSANAATNTVANDALNAAAETMAALNAMNLSASELVAPRSNIANKLGAGWADEATMLALMQAVDARASSKSQIAMAK